MASECDHMSGAFYYLTEKSINEAGWRCTHCQSELGYRPDLDRKLIHVKVDGLLHDLHDHHFVYISNGTHGEIIAELVSRRCIELDRFDTYTILRELMLCPEMRTESRGDFWAKEAKRRGLRAV